VKVRRHASLSVVALCVAGSIGAGVFATDPQPAPAPGTPNGPAANPVEVASELDLVTGEDAVEQLEETDTLEEVAEEIGVEPEILADAFEDDPGLFLTDSGDVGYVEAAPPASLVDGRAPMALPLGVDVARLSSRPGSSRTLLLDFDGHLTADPVWTSLGAPAIINSAPSGASPETIFEVWQRVREDYLPFDVNVTTLDPGLAAMRRSGPNDGEYGQRIVISPTNFAGAGTLGVAIVGSFDDVDADRPAFVFTDGGGTRKSIAEAVSHEAGHTFGLFHDGFGGQDYYDGHGQWAPIMGRAISATKPVSQWSKGEYAGANRFEDDIARIDFLTDGRPDDHGGTLQNATVVAANSTTGGVIAPANEVDMFAVDVGAGPLSVTVRPPAGAAAWSNLAVGVVVLNSGGAAVASGSVGAPTGWSVDLAPNVPAGRYFIQVRPIGWLDASSGFTTYGSLGAYEVIVSAAQGAAPPVAPATVTPITPNRLVDTRNGIGGKGRRNAGRQVVVQVTDGATVPFDATAAIVTVTAVIPSRAGFITAYPCSEGRPDTSTVNFVAGQTVANTTIAALSSAGQLCVWTDSDTDILVDITGWLGPSGSSRLTPIGPTRVVDTRNGVGGVRLGAGAVLAVNFNGIVPAGSTAVAVNATAVGAAGPAFLTVFPCAGSVPQTSTVNYVAGEARPNNVIVGLSGGQACVYTYGETDVLIDLVGAFGPSGLSYKPTPPQRVLDTRQGQPPIPPGGAIAYGVDRPGLAPDAADAAFVNVTAADHTVPGYTTTYDCVTRRDTSTLNQQVGQAAANGAIVPLTNLQSCAWMYGGGHLIVDLNGWWIR
jgi:hypothetical protein